MFIEIHQAHRSSSRGAALPREAGKYAAPTELRRGFFSSSINMSRRRRFPAEWHGREYFNSLLAGRVAAMLRIFGRVSDRGERMVEDFEEKVGVAFVHAHRRSEADRLPVKAAFAEQESKLSRCLEDLRALGLRGF